MRFPIPILCRATLAAILLCGSIAAALGEDRSAADDPRDARPEWHSLADGRQNLMFRIQLWCRDGSRWRLAKMSSPPPPARNPGINPALPDHVPASPIKGSGRFAMSDHDHHDDGVSRRRVLECMTWAGTGVLWTITGGVPRSLGLVGSAQAAEPAGMTFLQISDSHVGFDKPANPNALGTLEEAINKIKAMPKKPSFMIHTGDITHLSKAKRIRRCRSHHLAGQARRALRAGRARLHRRGGQAL